MCVGRRLPGMPEDPAGRRGRLVEAIVEARRADEAVVLGVEGGDGRATYEDRSLRVEVDDEERERLEDLLAEFHVFKVRGPETRKAREGVVHLSAVTDPKHAADFLEALFREVYGAPEDYSLRVEA